MKIHLLTDPSEVFDAPRGIALALIAAKVCAEHDTTPAPINPEVKWSMASVLEPGVKAYCPVCKLSSILRSVNATFKHCGTKTEYMPPEHSEALYIQFENLKKSRGSKPPRTDNPAQTGLPAFLNN
jgi:hypothetical protein